MATYYTDETTFERDWWPQGRTIDRRFVVIAAEAAFNYINAALARYYAVPFSTTPGIVATISNMLTRTIVEWLVDFGRLPKVADVDEKSLLSPIEMLKMICSGELQIEGETRLTTTGAYLNTAGYKAIFDQDNEIWHEVDQDRLDDIYNERL